MRIKKTISILIVALIVFIVFGNFWTRKICDYDIASYSGRWGNVIGRLIWTEHNEFMGEVLGSPYKILLKIEANGNDIKEVTISKLIIEDLETGKTHTVNNDFHGNFREDKKSASQAFIETSLVSMPYHDCKLTFTVSMNNITDNVTIVFKKQYRIERYNLFYDMFTSI